MRIVTPGTLTDPGGGKGDQNGSDSLDFSLSVKFSREKQKETSKMEEKTMSAEMREGYVQAAKDWFSYQAECEMSTEDLIYNLGQCFALTKAEIIDILESNGCELTQEWIDEYNDVNYDETLTLKRLRNWINDAAVDGGDPEDYDDEDEDEEEEEDDEEDEEDEE